MSSPASEPAPYRSYIQPNADADFPAEKGRYHLYVNYACPFACRALSARNLLGLEDFISVSFTHVIFQRTRPEDDNDEHRGWAFFDPAISPSVFAVNGKEYPTEGATVDHVNHKKYVREIYELVDKTPRAYTVPLLWDKKKQTIVSNESADIVSMFNSGFRELVASTVDLVPHDRKDEIDALNNGIAAEITSAWFKLMFAKGAKKSSAFSEFFAAVDKLNEMLAVTRYLAGSGITEPDVRVFLTLIRADVISYADPMKKLATYPNVVGYMRDLYQTPGFKATVHFPQLKISFVDSDPNAEPVEGPFIDYEGTHGRASL